MGVHSYYILLPFTGFDDIHVYISHLRSLGRTRSYNYSKFSVIWKMLWYLSNSLAEIIVPNNILFKIRNHLLQIEQNFCFDKSFKTFVRLAYTNTCFYKYNSFFMKLYNIVVWMNIWRLSPILLSRKTDFVSIIDAR